jgi:hypothetical protein
MQQHRIVFCYNNENFPILFGFGHGLKLKNTFSCESNLLKTDNNEKILNKEGIFNTKHIFIEIKLILNSDNFYEFKDGYIKIDNKKYTIKKYVVFSSLQIENYCFDNIGVLQLETNIFDNYYSISSTL